MSDVNTATVSGRLTRDPELRTTTNGTAVCNLGIACSRSRKGDDGSYTEETSFFDCVVWSGFGELVARKCQKGDLVTVSGRLQQRSWEADDGSKRSKVEIVADEMDGPGFYRPASEDNTGGGEYVPAASQASGAATPPDDDIPF